MYNTHKESDNGLIRPKHVVRRDKCMKQVMRKRESGKYTSFQFPYCTKSARLCVIAIWFS